MPCTCVSDKTITVHFLFCNKCQHQSRHSRYNTRTSKTEMKLKDPSTCQTPFHTQKTCLFKGMTYVCMTCTPLNFPYAKTIKPDLGTTCINLIDSASHYYNGTCAQSSWLIIICLSILIQPLRPK
jgi:hypothetical protein